MDKLLFYTLNNKGLPSGPNFNRTNTLGKLSMLKEGGDMFPKKPLMPKFNHGGQYQHPIDLKIKPFVKDPNYRYGFSEFQPKEGNLMLGAGFGNSKIGMGAMGMTPLEAEKRKYWKGLIDLNINANVNDRTKLKFGVNRSGKKTGFNVGLNHKFEEGGEKDAAWAARIRKGLGPEYANYNDQQIRELYGQGKVMTKFGEDGYVAPELDQFTVTSETDKERRDAKSARAAKYFREEKPVWKRIKKFIASDSDWRWLGEQAQTVADWTVNPIIDGVSYVANDPGQATRDVVNTVADGVSWVANEGNLDSDGTNVFGAKHWDHAGGAMHVLNAIPTAGLFSRGAAAAKPLLKSVAKKAGNTGKGAVRYADDVIKTSIQAGKPKLPTYKQVSRWEPNHMPDELVNAGTQLTPQQQALTGSWYTHKPEQLGFYATTRPGAGKIKNIRMSNAEIANLEKNMSSHAKGMSGKQTNKATDSHYLAGELNLPKSLRSRGKDIKVDLNPSEYIPQSFGTMNANSPLGFAQTGQFMKELVNAGKEKAILGINRQYFPFQEGGEYVDLELDKNDIEYYKNQGYLVEYLEGGANPNDPPKKSDDGAIHVTDPNDPDYLKYLEHNKLYRKLKDNLKAKQAKNAEENLKIAKDWLDMVKNDWGETYDDLDEVSKEYYNKYQKVIAEKGTDKNYFSDSKYDVDKLRNQGKKVRLSDEDESYLEQAKALGLDIKFRGLSDSNYANPIVPRPKQKYILDKATTHKDKIKNYKTGLEEYSKEAKAFEEYDKGYNQRKEDWKNNYNSYKEKLNKDWGEARGVEDWKVGLNNADGRGVDYLINQGFDIDDITWNDLHWVQQNIIKEGEGFNSSSSFIKPVLNKFTEKYTGINPTEPTKPKVTLPPGYSYRQDDTRDGDMNDYLKGNKRISREEFIEATGYAPTQFRERHIKTPKFKEGGSTEPEYIYLELDDDAIQQYRDGGYTVEEYEEGGDVDFTEHGWDYKREGDTYFTKRENTSDWINTTGNSKVEAAIKSKIYDQPAMVDNTILDNAVIDNATPKESIKEIQTKLVDAGYNIGHFADGTPLIDGDFGTKTEDALANYNKGIAPELIINEEPIVNAEPVEIPTTLTKEVEIPEYIGNLKDGFLPTLEEYGEETCSKEGGCSFNTSKKMGNLLANSVPDLKKLWADDAWFNKDKQLKDKGSLIFNTDERDFNKMPDIPKELYSKFQVGDYVHLNRVNTSSSYKYAKKTKGNLKNEKIEHMGFIIGADTDGTPLVWHGSETGVSYVQRMDELITLKDQGLEYKISSVVRNPELKEFNEEAREMLNNTPFYSPFNPDIKISNPPQSTATPTQKTAYQSVNNSMKRFKDQGYNQSETAMVGQLLVGGIMHMESKGNTGTGYFKRGLAKQPAAYIWKEGLGQGEFEGDEASWGIYQMKPNYNFKEGKYLTKYEYDDQGKKIKGSAYKVSNPRYGQLNDLGKKLKTLGVELDDIFDSYENQTIAGQLILLENYNHLKEDPKFDRKTGLWDGRIPASYILAKSWQAGSGWQNRDKYQKYLEDTDITYSEEALKHAVESGWMEGIEIGAGNLLWDRDHTNALKQGFDNTSQKLMQGYQDYKRMHPDELSIGEEGYEEQRKKQQLEDTLPKPYTSESTGTLQRKINFEDMKALKILDDLNIKKENYNKNYGSSTTLTKEEADRIRPKRPRTKAETNDAYRKWANSTPFLTKKYGKESQYNLDAVGKPNEWFDRAYKAGEEAYKNSLLPPKAPNLHLKNYSKYGGQIRAEDVFIKEWLGSLKTKNNR